MITKSGYATKKSNVTQEKVNSYRQLLNEPAQEETSAPVVQEQVKPVNIRDLSVSNVLPKPKVNISAGEVKPLNMRNFVNEINNTPEAKRANLTVQTDSLKKQINTKEQEYARANNISDWNTKRQEQSRIQQELNSLREQLDSKNQDLVMLGGYNLLSGEQVEQFNKNAPLTQKIDKALKYDIPTTAKKVGRTAMDLAMQIPTAAYDVYEGALDATVANVGALGSTIADKTGNKDIANKIREGATKFVNITPSSKPLVEEAKNKGEGIYEPKVLGIKVRDALYSISNMITAAYSGGLPMMALSASGQNIEEALTDNQSLERAVAYGDISGAIESLTEKMFDAVKIVGGGKFDKFLPKSAIGKLIGGSAGEGIEEIISNGLNPFVKQLTYEKGTYDLPDFYEYIKMLGESFWNGAVIGAIMKGGQDISTPQFREQYKQDVYTAVDKSKLPDNIKEQVKEAMLTPAQAQINQDLAMIRNSSDYQRTQQTNMLPTYSQIQQANLAQNQVNQQQNIETQQTTRPNQNNAKNQLKNDINNLNISQDEKQNLIETLNSTELNTETEQEIRNIINTIKSESLSDITSSFEANKPKYNQYKNAKIDNKILDNAKNTVQTKDGRRTVAKNLANDIYNMPDSEVEKYAYKSWIDSRPNAKENLNRQGKGYTKFTMDEWVNTIYRNVKELRNRTQAVAKKVDTTQMQMPTAKTNAVYNTAKKLNVDVQLANRVMDMAKLTEVPVNGFVDVNENIDGYYKDGAIYINKNSKKAQDRIFVHELTHNIEKADGWQGLRDTIFNSNVLYNELAEKGQTLDEYRQLIKDRYAENGIELNEDDVDREVIAKFAEQHLLKDQKSIDRMVQENPTFMQRVKNFIDDLVVKFKGTAEEKELLRIQRMYDKAFAESKQVETSKTQKVQYGINDTVPKGYTRLYRGLNQEFDRNYDKKKIDNVNGYESWTDSYELAKAYGDNVYYIDIPTSEIKDSIIDENPQSETYGDRNLMYVHDKKVGLKGESGKEYMLYTGHDNYANLEYKKADAPSEKSYSINTDNQGRELSKQQQEFFKDSKVRDENGKLLEVYHGTEANVGIPKEYWFNTFDINRTGANGSVLGDGFYFTDNLERAQRYAHSKGNVYTTYLNITNPFEKSRTQTFKEAVEEINPDFDISRLFLPNSSRFDGKRLREYLIENGYDGVFLEGTYVAFEPNQIKAVDNLNPTENEDIRYSVETREVDFPEKVGDRYLSRHAKTLAESGVTMPETVDLIEKMVKDGSLTHERITDKKALAYAEKYIEENGFKDAVEHWNHLTKSNRELSKEELALGQLIFNTANTNQDVQLVKKMIADLVVKGTQAGRSLQAMSMVKKMTPDGRLYSLERTVQKLNQDLREQFGKDFKDIEIPDDLAEKLLKSKTTKETDAAVEEIQQYIADRVPATWGDKANAWRDLAMLGNPRTHIRNVLGNAVFIPAVEIKNLIATGIEKTLPKAERTKAIVGFKDTDLLNFAESDFDTHQEAVRGENKYDITAGVKEKQRVFNNKVLETLRKKNFELLEKEDATFLKYHYKRAMASALKARGITLKELRSGTPEAIKKLDEVRQYAINEAQKATYRDFNSMANWVSSQKRRLKRASGTSKAAKVGSIVAEGIIPFTKTPANILKRGIEYSPVGLAKGIYDAMTQVKKGNVTASQAIDEMAAGLTGTGIVMLGALLKSLGLIVGGDEEKQKEQNFEKLKGNQNYALKIGNKTYTIDWMAPSSMPLFVGVEVVDLLEAENISDIIGSIGNITDPVFELSMLQGLNSTMNTLGSDNPIAETFSNTVESYFGQYNPTFLGQIARTIDPKRRTTYADKNSIVPSGIQTFAQKQLQKIPCASKTLPTYKDQFGRESVTENVVERIFSNFLSPGYLADVKDQPVENELTKLYEKTGEIAILPSYATKSITVNKEKKNLTAKEYDTFAKVRGNVAYDNLEKLMTSQEYKSMDDEQKIKAIKKIYDYANSVGKSKVSDYELTKSEQQIQDYEKAGIDYYKWLILQDKADTNKNGYVTKDEMNKALNKSGLTSTQKALIKKNMNKSK